MIVGIISAYLLVILAIGWLSNRQFRGTATDYFVATRSIGAFLLLMSLFGTNMTAFSLLGASGEAYRRGIGVFGLMASSTALVTPILFLTIAPRVWEIGKRLGHTTQVQLVRDRWGSDSLGLGLFTFLVVLLVPYLLIGIKGGGLTVSQITEGAIPEWVGGLVMILVVLIYVTAGGLRGTAWANAAQTVVFTVLGGVTFVLVLVNFGGLSAAFQKVGEVAPELLVRGERIRPLELLSYFAIPLSAATFPHIFLHWLTARDLRTFRLPAIAFPLCVAAVWLPSVTIGVLGAVDFPDLVGPGANSVFIRMIGRYAPGALAGFLAAGVLAAVMSSLDSQTLSLSNMFTNDIVRRYRKQMSDGAQVLSGRIFVVLVLALTYGISLLIDSSIFKLGIWAFSGFSALTPIIVAALFWRRSTAAGAWAALLTAASLWVFFLAKGWSVPHYSVGGTGLMPVVVMLLGASLAMIVVSLATAPPEDERLARFFPDLQRSSQP